MNKQQKRDEVKNWDEVDELKLKGIKGIVDEVHDYVDNKDIDEEEKYIEGKLKTGK